MSHECSGRGCLDERGVIAWTERAWRTAVREGWDWEGYYFHLFKVALTYIMLHRHGRLL